MAKRKTSQKRARGRFCTISDSVITCANFAKLNGSAVKLLMYAATLYRGENNGDLCLASQAKKACDWESKSQLENARDELEHYGFITKTKQGRRRAPNLYALNWFAIDPCGGKHHVQATTQATEAYLIEQPEWQRSKTKKRSSIQEQTVVSIQTGEVFEHEYEETGA